MKKIEIREITLNDIDQLLEIGRQTFYETFIVWNTEENLNIYLDERFTVGKLTDELNNKDSEFYFALFDNKVIGYLKINTGKAQTELQDDRALEIERIYVLKEFHGKNVGQLIYEKAIQIAEQKNVTYVWLGVWENNSRARNFYSKNGFVEFDKHIFRMGNSEQTDLMMKLLLKK